MSKHSALLKKVKMAIAKLLNSKSITNRSASNRLMLQSFILYFLSLMRNYSKNILLLLIISFTLTGCATHTVAITNNATNINLTLAMQYLQKNMLIQAKQHFIFALQQSPHDPLVLSGYGFYLQQIGDAKAKQVFAQALHEAGQQPMVLNNIAVFYCQQHHYTQAMRLFKQALQIRQYLFSAQLYENMGICADMQVGCAQSLPYFKAALRRDAHLHYSQLRVKQCLSKKH